MKPSDLDQLVEAAREAARAGGHEIRASFAPLLESDAGRGAPQLRTKDDVSYNLVTATDEASEKAIIDVLLGHFPSHSILAEESRSQTPETDDLWIIDPLDGTNNFAHGINHCAVSIAYRKQGETRIGIVYNPLTGDWYEARRDAGATFNGQRLRVSAADTIERILVGVGFYYDRGTMMEATLAAIRELFRRQIHGVRRFGTASLDLCQVAAGRFGAFFEYRLAPWDFAAGALIVSEAGGRASDVQGNPLAVRTGSVLAAAPGIYETVREIVSRFDPNR